MGILHIRCPYCGTDRDVDDRLFRRSVVCQRCKREFTVRAALGASERLVRQVIEAKYHIRELLREGGFALVFRADEIAGGEVVREVAVKFIYPDPKIPRTEQAEELVATLKLSHPYTVRGISAGSCDLGGLSWLYLVMELADESLEDRIARRLLHPSEAWEMTEQIGDALAYLHKDPDRLVHRDLKPANVLRFEHCWKLADFGLAYTMELVAGKENRAGCTERYMPPEGIEGMITPAWDMWAFGVMLTEAITGQHPFDSDRHIVFAITQLEPNVPADLPEPFNKIIDGCLIKKRSLRWTAPQVLAALHNARGLRASLAGIRWTISQHLRRGSNGH